MTPAEAIAIIRQLPPHISATPAVHAQIQEAIAVIEALTKPAAKPAKRTK